MFVIIFNFFLYLTPWVSYEGTRFFSEIDGGHRRGLSSVRVVGRDLKIAHEEGHPESLPLRTNQRRDYSEDALFSAPDKKGIGAIADPRLSIDFPNETDMIYLKGDSTISIRQT